MRAGGGGARGGERERDGRKEGVGAAVAGVVITSHAFAVLRKSAQCRPHVIIPGLRRDVGYCPRGHG